ncbi:Roadkill [Operophtera brumata]|uniref:Roadkill n=1 Tax=Operophtera brumata TaxID=104452 RepID=A0A0L7K1Z2_OPEBR|nr:Roadkill [Operophtera brumata]
MEDNPNKYTIKLDKSTDTTDGIDTYNITWTIPIINQLLQTKAMDDVYRTLRHTVVEVPDTPFKMKVSFYGNAVIMICYLSSTSLFMKWSLEFKLANFSDVLPIKDYETIQANQWQYCRRIINLNNLSRDRTAPLYLSFKLIVSHAVKAGICRNIPLPYIELSEDFGILLTDDSFSDVTIKSAEGIEFKAHKNVLAVRSNVLRAHFEHSTKENISNVVETQWDTEVLRDVLTFVYTDEVPRVDDAPEKLLVAADYYELDRLTSLCEEALSNRLTVENAIDTLQLAELYSLNALILSTLNFIKNEPFKLIKETQGWKNIQSVEFIHWIYDVIVADGIILNYNDHTDILAAALNEVSIK